MMDILGIVGQICGNVAGGLAMILFFTGSMTFEQSVVILLAMVLFKSNFYNEKR